MISIQFILILTNQKVDTLVIQRQNRQFLDGEQPVGIVDGDGGILECVMGLSGRLF